MNEPLQQTVRSQQQDAADAVEGTRATQDRGTARLTGRTALEPLTPEFKPAQHQSYIEHLNDALDDDKVRNIALTGRYGSGKSSVLEEFARQTSVKKRVLFLALSTLGPSGEPSSGAETPEGRTNQIEKELVKQLLHREKPSRLRQSRYQRIQVLHRRRAASEAVVALTSLIVALWAFNTFPAIPGLSEDHVWWARLGAAAILGGASVVALTWLRLAAHNRFVVSEVSAAGASITLAGKTGSYFDEYLDEIIYFFESLESIDVVVFEDLDRFDDPGIFEALRELNTLLNSSKQMDGRTIRFIYALRDSIFERLGEDGATAGADAARSEAVRANRTKFFDLVIPIVPFITHRTARDLLTELLQDSSRGPVAPVSAELVDLTSRHLPDMRLLTNIRNEFVVFTDRLITDRHGIQGLDPDQLFALVVYKNVHLGDFEKILLGQSNLDTVYRKSRELISQAIDLRRGRLRTLSDEVAIPKRRAELAEARGNRLTWYARALLRVRAERAELASFSIGERTFGGAEVRDPDFWDELIEQGESVSVAYSIPGQPPRAITIPIGDLRELLGDALAPDDWTAPDEAERAGERGRLTNELEQLRTADFKELASHGAFVLAKGDQSHTFASLLARHIDSDVGRALITAGFIDRYYTLYVSQYYGTHVPPNAMNFIRQNVDTNIADPYYRFDSSDEIAAVLRETRSAFLSDISAENLAILDYLLDHGDRGAETVLDSVVRRLGEPGQTFFGAFLSDGRHAAEAVAYLATTWPGILAQLVRTDISEAEQVRFVDEALANSEPTIDYEIGEAVQQFLTSHYADLASVSAEPDSRNSSHVRGSTETSAHPQERTRRTTAFMARLRIPCADLSALSPAAIRMVVDSGWYEITAQNLRTALPDVAKLSLNRIRGVSDSVYKRVINNPEAYLAAITSDIDAVETTSASPLTVLRTPGAQLERTYDAVPRTPWSIDDPDSFAEIVATLEDQSTEHIAAIVERAHPGCTILDLADVPETTWGALVATKRFRVTVFNVATLIEHHGDLTSDLADALQAAQVVIVPAAEDDSDDLTESKVAVAEAILKASGHLPDPETRVHLVASLELEHWFPASNVLPEPGRLLGLLIAERVCADQLGTFERFTPLDWDTLRFAIKSSANFIEFMAPHLFDAHLKGALLVDTEIDDAVKEAMLARYGEFIDDDAGVLDAAGRAALHVHTHLSVEQIGQIASGTNNPDLVTKLIRQADKAISVDEVIEIYSRLPAPFAELAVVGARPILDRDEHLDAVLTRLRDAKRIETKAHRKTIFRPARVEVTVLR